MHDQPDVPLACRQYIDGDEGAAETICAHLESPIRTAAASILGRSDADLDDIVQDTQIAMLGYLRRSGSVPDNPVAFAVRIARNRCFNLGLWRRRRLAQNVDDHAETLPAIAANPLDLLDREQNRRIVAQALASLDPECRALLEAVYHRESSMEALRHRLGLGSVQAVYHRRNVCLEKMRKRLNRLLFDCRNPRSKP
ncbi:MAG TPA: sigma-70 family RNA polymerase sigma factor [Candidatus Krumholzibacteria bacterium]|nr:sigma-70 family RNA polymerase sigma factor [Candidatus Krumholzibacteria bacterium]HRX52731.1 sigma-70 family RNA polymerase sigma factor [Candidatus Krumholzibacteria bacterium]